MISDYLTHKIDALRELLHSNSLTDWLIAGIVAVAVWAGLWIVRRLVASRYKKYAAAHNRMPVRLLAYLIGNTRQFLFIAIALDAAQASLTLPERVQRAVVNIVLILILLQVGLWAGRAVRFYLETKELERGPDKVFAGSLDIINFVASILIWSLLILVALDNLGVNITALLAGLGVGGVAVALALQNVLGDLFASLSIALDKPFATGDRLEIDAYAGKVEHIGIKTTRLRSDSGEQIILSNADILKSRVRNYGRALEQRALTTIRVNYDTPTDTLRSHPQDARRHRPRAAERAFRALSFEVHRRFSPALRTVLLRATTQPQSIARSAAGREFPHHRRISPFGRRLRLSDAARDSRGADADCGQMMLQRQTMLRRQATPP